MTPDHQCETTDSDSNWEDIENEMDLYPTLELDSEDWAERFTNSIRTYHGVDSGTPTSRKICENLISLFEFKCIQVDREWPLCSSDFLAIADNDIVHLKL